MSTVGSGDALLAGFLSARFQKLDLPECLRHALAVAAANTQLLRRRRPRRPHLAPRSSTPTDVVERRGRRAGAPECTTARRRLLRPPHGRW